jgi:hypothetical protein
VEAASPRCDLVVGVTTATLSRGGGMSISFLDLQLAFDFVSADGPGANQALLDRRSGKVHYHSELMGDVEEEEFPEDVDDERYVAIPHKNELDLGKPLVLDFVRQFLLDDYDEVRDIFRRKGAYGRFKALLARRGALDRWYDFSNEAEEAALKKWCADNAIDLAD